MNSKVVWHLFKHGVALKKESYLYLLLTIAVLILFQVLSTFYHFPAIVKLMIPLVGVIFVFSLVLNSALIPGSSKVAAKGVGGHYTWGYVLSTIRFPKDLLFAFFLELILDSIFLMVISIIALPKLEWWIMCGSMSIGALIFIRPTKLLNGLRGTKGRSTWNNEKTDKINSKMIIFGLVAFGFILMESDQFISLIPPSLMSYLSTPLIIGFAFYFPFLIYHTLVTDYNYQESSLYIKKVLALGSVVVLVSLVYFYNNEMKSGYIIFDEIREGNVEQVEKQLRKHKSVFNLRDEDTNLSPLLFAAKYNQSNIVKLILNNGGNINETDYVGNNLLTYTAIHCNYDLSDYLVRKGINYKHMPSDNMNPLFDAAANNCLPLITFFRKLKMEEGAINKQGQNYIQFGSVQNAEFKSVYKFLFRNGLF